MFENRTTEDKISWNNLSGNLECKFSLDFISEYKDKWNWYYICDNYSLPEDFIRQHIDYINWYSISRYRILSSQLIRDFADKVDWKGISIQPHLDINLIKDYPDKVCWKYIFYNWYINDFEDYEIICVDDGSTDSSLAILEEYAQRDNRIKHSILF